MTTIDPGAIGKHLAAIVVADAAQSIRGGVFDDTISAAIVGIIRTGGDAGLTRTGFILKIAIELMDRSRGRLTLRVAQRMAVHVYEQFRQDNRPVKFGDEGWDWSGAGARILAEEYEIANWEFVA